jgi:hypothetical protein
MTTPAFLSAANSSSRLAQFGTLLEFQSVPIERFTVVIGLA